MNVSGLEAEGTKNWEKAFFCLCEPLLMNFVPFEATFFFFTFLTLSFL